MVQLDGVMEMTDKELIKLAAKACGFGDQDGNFIWTESEHPRGSKTNGALWNYMGWCDTAQLWNPITDDGDALRLAVRLRLMVNVCPYIVIATDGNIHAEEETGKQSDAKATRRAITRAAAQIGKEME